MTNLIHFVHVEKSFKDRSLVVGVSCGLNAGYCFVIRIKDVELVSVLGAEHLIDVGRREWERVQRCGGMLRTNRLTKFMVARYSKKSVRYQDDGCPECDMGGGVFVKILVRLMLGDIWPQNIAQAGNCLAFLRSEVAVLESRLLHPVLIDILSDAG